MFKIRTHLDLLCIVVELLITIPEQHFTLYWCGVCRDNLGACRPIHNYSLKEQTEPNQNRSFPRSLGAIQLCKRPNS